MPKYDLCETDYISLAEKFANLEARMGSLEIVASEHKAELLQVKDNYLHLRTSVDRIEADRPVDVTPNTITLASIVKGCQGGTAFQPYAGSGILSRPNLQLHATGSGPRIEPGYVPIAQNQQNVPSIIGMNSSKAPKGGVIVKQSSMRPAAAASHMDEDEFQLPYDQTEETGVSSAHSSHW